MKDDSERALFVSGIIYNLVHSKEGKKDPNAAATMLDLLKESEDAVAVLTEAFRMIRGGDPAVKACAEFIETAERLNNLLCKYIGDQITEEE